MQGRNNYIKAPPLIPRSIIFSDPDYSSVRLSPDGKWLTWISAFENVPNIWAKQMPDGKEFCLTKEKGRGIFGFGWNFDNQTLLYAQDKDGDENWRLYLVNVTNGEQKLLTDTLGVKASVIASSNKKPNQIVIGLNNRDPRYHDAWTVDLKSGNQTILFYNDYFKGYVFDDELNIRMLSNETDDGGEIFWKYNNGSITHYRTVSFEDSDSTSPMYFDPSGKFLYWLDSEGRDKNALFAVDFESGAKSLIYEAKDADIASILGHPITNEPLAVVENYMKPKRILLDNSIKEDFEILRKAMPDNAEPNILSTSLDFNIWLVVPSTDRAPASYYLYNRGHPKKPVKFLFNSKASLGNYSTVPMHAVEIPIADGLKQVCYLTLPLETDPFLTGTPMAPVPTVLQVHGGPWSRDSWSFNVESQYLANRGYAVLSCNFRGSTGYGKRLLNAGNGQWGLKMQQDLTDAVMWAVSHNISDPKKVAISGGSYGGYAALAGLAFTPDLYACGIDVVGPSNLITLMQSIPPYWKPLYNQFKQRIGGDPETQQGMDFLKSISPFYHSINIKKPLLIAQGANDPRVKQFESDQIVEALHNSSIPVTYALFPNEGHGFARSENRLAFNALSEMFLAKCLGGRAEAVGEDLVKSSIQIQNFDSNDYVNHLH